MNDTLLKWAIFWFSPTHYGQNYFGLGLEFDFEQGIQ